MPVPNSKDPAWYDLISGKANYEFEFLAVKLLIGRLSMRYKIAPTEVTMQSCAEELVAFFEKNKHLPPSRADLKKIFGEGAEI